MPPLVSSSANRAQRESGNCALAHPDWRPQPSGARSARSSPFETLTTEVSTARQCRASALWPKKVPFHFDSRALVVSVSLLMPRSSSLAREIPKRLTVHRDVGTSQSPDRSGADRWVPDPPKVAVHEADASGRSPHLAVPALCAVGIAKEDLVAGLDARHG